MYARLRRMTFVFSMSILLVPALTLAQWVQDGIQVTSGLGTQYTPQLVADGVGGAYVVWADDRTGDLDIYVQHYDASGNALLPAGGRALCTHAESQLNPLACSDGGGGLFVVWRDFRGASGNDIYCQWMGSDGVLQLGPDGNAIHTSPDWLSAPGLVPDGHDGFVVWWERQSLTERIETVRVDKEGSHLWAGVLVAGSPGPDLDNARLVIHPGATVASTRIGVLYNASATLDYKTYAQRITLEGALLWGSHGVVVENELTTYNVRDAIDSGSAGTILAWQYSSGGTYHVRIQKLDRYGSPQWGDGIDAEAEPGEAIAPTLVSDGDGGCYYTTGNTVYYIRHDGFIYTGEVGELVGSPGGWTIRDGRIAQLANGDLVVLFERIYGNVKYRLQRLGIEYGQRRWHDDGMALNLLTHTDDGGVMMVDGEYVWAAWIDDRTYEPDIYLQRVSQEHGFWAGPEPVITSVDDIPADEGGWVRVNVRASEWEPSHAPELIHSYTLWRRFDAARASAGAVTAPDDARLADLSAKTRSAGLLVADDAAQALGLPAGTWESLGLHHALGEPVYHYPAPTRTDFVDAEPPWEVFVVTAHTAEPGVYYASAPDSGCSIDNLAPGLLTGLAGAASYAPSGLELDWDASPASDLADYVVHRGPDPAFEPDPGTLVATPTAPAWFDPDWNGGEVYKVAARDRHGNVGDYAVLNSDQATGTGGAPARFRLLGASPNPFNPRTTIRFELPAARAVDLRIYDASGRLVRDLLRGERLAAGRHGRDWDGRDGDGRISPAGVYFYRLDAGDDAGVGRAVLLK